MTQLNQNTTDLQSILDAVNALPENVPFSSVLLWTNASPTSAFAAQSVSVAGADYDGYLVENKANTSSNDRVVTYVPKNKVTILYNYYPASYTRRSITTANDTTLTFTSAASGDSTCIPTRIWGVKFTL